MSVRQLMLIGIALDILSTFTNNNDNETSGLTQIFKGSSPFGDGGELEVLEGHPEGALIPFMPDAPQEFTSGWIQNLEN
jgi:hypothetical protein